MLDIPYIVQENKQRMEQLQPKITEMNELMSQMKDAEGVDPEELSQLQSELKDFDSRMDTLNDDISKEEDRWAMICNSCFVLFFVCGFMWVPLLSSNFSSEQRPPRMKHLSFKNITNSRRCFKRIGNVI